LTSGEPNVALPGGVHLDASIFPKVPTSGGMTLNSSVACNAARSRRSPNIVKQPSGEEAKLHTPEEIADRLGGISLKTLHALIRNRGLETTTLGYADPSRNGGPRRRLWAMNDAQLEALLAVRNRHGQPADQR
jgi:hypothetical protein